MRVVRLGRSRDTGTGTGTEYEGDTGGVYSGGGFERPLQQLGNVDVIKQGTSALKAAAQTVETQAQALDQTASAQCEPQVDALQSAIDNLKTVLQQLGNQPNLGQAAGQLSAAVSQGTSAGQNLINAIDQRCPGGLPTVSPTGTASATA